MLTLIRGLAECKGNGKRYHGLAIPKGAIVWYATKKNPGCFETMIGTCENFPRDDYLDQRRNYEEE